MNYFIYILFILYILNFLNKIYLGDNGAYLIGLIFSICLIDFYNDNHTSISPFFIVLLLWYPAFENLFSILRKINFKGYAFQIALKFWLWKKNFRIIEFPITFTDRTSGDSKMNTSIINEAIFGIIGMKWRSVFKKPA